MKAELNTAVINSGVQSAMTSGEQMMLRLYADSWATLLSVSYLYVSVKKERKKERKKHTNKKTKQQQQLIDSFFFLFFFSDATAYGDAFFGPGTGAILLDNVACLGTEANLTSCSSTTDTSDCVHAEDASVTCIPDCKDGILYLHSAMKLLLLFFSSVL